MVTLEILCNSYSIDIATEQTFNYKEHTDAEYYTVDWVNFALKSNM